MVGSLRGQKGPRPIPGLIHITPAGSKERCRCRVGKCPYGGPHGRSLTRQRKNSEGVYVEPPAMPPAYENLPLMTLGTGRHTQALELEAKARQVAFAGGNDEATMARLFPKREELPGEPERPVNPHNGKPYPPSYDVKMAAKWDELSIDEKLVEMDRLCRDRYAELGFADKPIYYTDDFKVAGSCRYKRVNGEKQVAHFEMSIPLAVTAGYDDLFDTINHEGAHGHKPHSGHDEEWAQACRENGGNGNQYHSTEMKGEFYRVRGTCEACGYQFHRKGMPRENKIHGGSCGGAISYDKNPSYVGSLNMNKALKNAGKDPNAMRASQAEPKIECDLDKAWDRIASCFNIEGYLRHCGVNNKKDQDYLMVLVRERWMDEVKPTHSLRHLKSRFKAILEDEGASARRERAYYSWW